jgi:hypothetical protein
MQCSHGLYRRLEWKGEEENERSRLELYRSLTRFEHCIRTVAHKKRTIVPSLVIFNVVLNYLFARLTLDAHVGPSNRQIEQRE